MGGAITPFLKFNRTGSSASKKSLVLMEGPSSSSALPIRLGVLLDTPPASVEIIPGDEPEWFADDNHASFLFIQNNLGVSQTILYEAYLQAVPIFSRSKSALKMLHLSASDIDPSSVKHLTYSSAVLLLANPAHQTALNARKSLVRFQFLDPLHELRFTAALLYVRDCAKQSILWHHRRWLLRRRCKAPPTGNIGAADCSPLDPRDQEDTLCDLTISAEALRTEFSLAARASETYPRNYYAWTHRSICFEALAALAHIPSPSQHLYVLLLSEELQAMKQWVERHVSEYTAVQYLRRVHDAASKVFNTNSAILSAPGSVGAELGSLCAPLVPHARSLVEAFPDHESLWFYLRAALAPSPPMHGSEDMQDIVQEITLQFLSHPKLHPRALSTVDAAVVHGHVCRFLAWALRQGGHSETDSAFVRRVVRADVDDKQLVRMLGLQYH